MPNNMTQVLVTGANGFVGMHLCQYLLSKGYQVRAIGRNPSFHLSHPHLSYHQIDNIDSNTNWHSILHGVDVVVHLAARVHHLKDKGMKSLVAYQEINVKGTQQLVKAAVSSEVKRFVYLSSIKVNGERTFSMPLRAEDQPRPIDAYGLSKLQAEQILQEGSRRSGMEWVIVRPPLVYGPHVKGNFRKLLTLAKTWFPLPLGALSNSRSFVSVYNLCSFIECCISHPHAQREVFLVSDNQDLSTSQLIRLIKRAGGKKSFLFPFPKVLLKLLGTLTGKRGQVDRLVDSLQLNIEKSMRLLNWQPPLSVEDSLKVLYQAENEEGTP
jgi:nucleoside-diphosphate-sugar epimerase